MNKIKFKDLCGHLTFENLVQYLESLPDNVTVGETIKARECLVARWGNTLIPNTHMTVVGVDRFKVYYKKHLYEDGGLPPMPSYECLLNPDLVQVVDLFDKIKNRQIVLPDSPTKAEVIQLVINPMLKQREVKNGQPTTA